MITARNTSALAGQFEKMAVLASAARKRKEHCDGCLRPVATSGMGMGTGRCGRSHRCAVIAGGIIASRPPGYVVYPGYAQPVYGPGCYWASRPVYDVAGRVVGYTGQPVQVCPGYVAPPPPGAAGAPPPAAPPSK